MSQFDVYTGTSPGPVADPPHVQLFYNGEDVSCDTLGGLSIDGGRSDKLAVNDASTCAFTLRWPQQMAIPTLGDTVDVAGWMPGVIPGPDNPKHALFHGTVTDVAMVGDDVSIVAADPLRDIHGATTGTTDVPTSAYQDYCDALWRQAAADLNDPAWMGHVNADAGAWPFNDWVWNRPADPANAWDEITQAMAWTNTAFYYRPHDTGQAAQSAPDDPTQWQPSTMVRPGLDPHPDPSQPLPVLPCQMLLATPRLWRNYGSYVNQWDIEAVTSRTVDTNGVKDERHSKVVTSVPSVRDRYGPRRGSIRTSFATQHTGLPTDIEKRLGEAWLWRTEIPVWQADNVVALFTKPMLARLSPQQRIDAWNVLAHGVGQLARYAMVETEAGAGVRPWMIEQTRVEWQPDGWNVSLVLTDYYSYRGGVGEINPRNSWAKLAAFHTDWDQVVAQHVDWSDVVATPHPHPTP